MSPSLRDQLQSALGYAYLLERELGGGGMSHVFLAHESALGRKVVVKVLLPELAAGVNVERFRREIQLAAQLQHPHIVPLLSAGEAEGLPYFIMPFVTGESLRARVAREGELPIAETIRILRDVVSALAYAHARGVVHRDVKPDNVLLSGGVAVVTDFGVAKAVSASAEVTGAAKAGVTSLGVALGTPAYMAPEQAVANPQTDHRADIYALGVMCYEMLTGQPPFSGRSPQQVLAAHVVEEPAPVGRRRPAVPPSLANLVHDCLAKRPADRPQSATEVLQALDAIATPSGGTAPTTAVRVPVGLGHLPAHRRRGPILLAAALAAILVVAGVMLLPRTRPSPDLPVVAPSRSAMPAAAPVGGDSAARAPAASPRSGADAPSGTDRAAEPAPPATPTAPRRTAPSRAAPHPAPARPARDSVTSRQEPRAIPIAPPTPVPAAAPGPAAAPAETASARAPAPPPPAPAAVAPVPAPAVVPAAPAPPADPRPEIQALVADYAAAVESESLGSLQRVYPEMTPAQRSGWEQFFQLVRDVKAELALGRLDVTNATAEAQVGGRYTYLNTTTQRTEHQPVAFRATLRREGGRWRIAQIH